MKVEADADPVPETYTVSFKMNGHGDAIDSQTINEGEKATEPTAPVAEGYTFGGWFTDAGITRGAMAAIAQRFMTK